MNTAAAVTAPAETSTVKAAPKGRWTASLIMDKVVESPKFTTAALLALYDRQTTDEKDEGDTRHLNGRGFNGSDAPFMSYCAEYSRKNNSTLSGDFLLKVRLRIKKYAKQLAMVANMREEEKAAAKAAEAAKAAAYAHAKVSCEEAALAAGQRGQAHPCPPLP